ncbi:MAG TPA: bifunctional DNA-formamidopyrimidine glycosylase/DNA-(apurinic or apyrimidinic site) lyase [Vicinamibacteria bacterium]|nr:bifunctional DNA-formamidopyrimidine glycosylase/DNA-(apurinic or apyrimidinic site) lyase [Vicinamibacteria bacterium]
MPELPEVEVTRRQLEPLLVGRRILAVTATAASRFFLTPPASVRRRLPGRRILGLDRIGKHLLVRLDSGDRLLLHLGMTGQIFGAGAASVRLMSSTAGASLSPERQTGGFAGDRHTHLRLRFEDGGPDVLFRDVRRFGRVQLLRPGEPPERLAQLGPDALEVRAGPLAAAVRRRAAAIKAVLLDQSVLAGVGNIYADEALFLSGIRPARRARSLDAAECRRLAGALRRVLRRAIATGGSSISDFVRPDGTDGAYQDERHVYGRTGEPCRRCRTPIRRLVIGGRSSHFCPRCQR